MTAALRAENGYLALDEARTKITANGFQRSEAEIRRTLISDVNAALAKLGRLCNQAFHLEPEESCSGEAKAIRRITTPDWTTLRQKWDAWRQTQSNGGVSIDLVFSANSTPIISLERGLPALTGLSFEANDENVNSDAGTLTFTLLPAVGSWTFSGAAGDGKEKVVRKNAVLGPSIVGEDRILAALSKFTGGLFRRAAIEGAVRALYPEGRVIRTLNDANDVVFSVTADPFQRLVEIDEGVRLLSAEIAATVPDSMVERAYYLLLPYRQFRAQRTNRRVVYPPDALPLIDRPLLGRLVELPKVGLAVEKFVGVQDSDGRIMPGVRLLSIVGDGSSSVTQLPNAPSRPLWGWVRLEGGARYRPGQGVSGSGGVVLQKLGAKPQSFSFRTGGTAAGALGQFTYSHDFLFFDSLHRRLSVNASGGTETQYHRVLEGVAANERRIAASARGDLELIPERAGTFLGTWLELERTTVLVQRESRPDQSIKFAGINLGVSFSRLTQGLGLRRSISFAPKLEAALPLADSLADFRIGSIASSFAQELGKGIEIHLSAHAAAASSGTPLVEMPVLGGAETVRGYRRDEALGRRFWALQNEIWVTPPFRGGAKWLDWVRQNIKLAPFFDAGGMYQVAQVTPAPAGAPAADCVFGLNRGSI